MTGRYAHRLVVILVACIASTSAAAAALPIPVDADTRDEAFEQRRHVTRRAKSEIGTPYVWGGASPRGFDCSGFTRWVFRGHGASLPHSAIRQFRLGTRPGNRRVWKRADLEVGDLVFHKTTSARVGHVGIYMGDGRFVTATSSRGVRIRSVWDPHYWGPRWVGATRLKATRRI